MNKLYFPREEQGLMRASGGRAGFPEDVREAFQKNGDDLEARGRELSRKYVQNPDLVSRGDVEDLIRDTYSLAVQMFEKKMSMGEILLPEEKEIYQLCKRETEQEAQSPQNGLVGGPLSFLFEAIERVRDCIDAVKEWFGISSERDKAGMYLVRQGNILLPKYATLIEAFFSSIADFFCPTPVLILEDLSDAQKMCADSYQQSLPIDKPLASKMLEIAGYGYDGHKENKSGEFNKLPSNQLPSAIRALYDESTGLLTSSRGLRVWLGRKGDDLVVSYSGTDTKSFDMIYADIIQLCAPSVLYLKAAGLLKTLMDQFTGSKFYVTGHSLGGGLTQFSLTANLKADTARLQGYGYNPAGLSMTSLNHLEEYRLDRAKSKVRMFMTCKDPVSAFGGKIGCQTTLPKTDRNGHGRDDLRVCMDKYLETPAPAPPAEVSLCFRNHSSVPDFIPYTRKLSIKDGSGTVYPIFNERSTAGADEFISVKVPKPFFDACHIPTTVAESCLGVYNGFNGTAHTVVNRLLLLTSGGPVITSYSTGNIHSSIIYSKFGMGMKEFLPLLEQVYADSGMTAPEYRTAYDKALAHLNDPFDFDKEAWFDGIRVQFGIDMRRDIFAHWPLAESYFNTFLRNLSSDRIDLYRSIYEGAGSTAKKSRDFLTQLKAVALKHLDTLLGEGVRWHTITEAQKNNYEKVISDFCDRVLAGLPG